MKGTGISKKQQKSSCSTEQKESKPVHEFDKDVEDAVEAVENKT